MFSTDCGLRGGDGKVETFKLVLHELLLFGNDIARQAVKARLKARVPDLGTDGPVKKKQKEIVSDYMYRMSTIHISTE